MKTENQHFLYWRYRISLIVAEIVKNKADIVAIEGNDHPEVIIYKYCFWIDPV